MRVLSKLGEAKLRRRAGLQEKAAET